MEVGEKEPVHVHCGASEGSKRRRKECRGVGRMGSGVLGTPKSKLARRRRRGGECGWSPACQESRGMEA